MQGLGPRVAVEAVTPPMLALAYRVALAASGAVGAAAFSLIAYRLARVARLTGATTGPAAGFALLALSHLWVLLEALSPTPRLAYAAYTGAAAASASGLLLILLPPRPSGGPAAALAPLLLFPSVLDAAAALLASHASASRFHGPARAAMLLYAAGHAARALGALLLPSTLGAALVAVGEAVRSASASAMAVYYAAGE